MTNKLEEIQEENRKFIIMANNPTAKTYEEALEMELGFGCKFYSKELDTSNIVTIYDINTNIEPFKILFGKSPNKFQDIQVHHNPSDSKIKIIGKPLTLNRVLIALKGLACNLCLLDVDENYNIFIRLDYPFSDIGSFYWDLTKETLEEQSEETQKEINRIINLN